MALEFDKKVRFTCAVQGLQYYRDIWDPSFYDSLKYYHERDNPFDRFSIKLQTKLLDTFLLKFWELQNFC